MWYSPGINDMTIWDQYLLSVYFIMTTMTTVGYGDNYATTTPERIFAIVLMIFGVFKFGFVSGALSSIISSFD